jgi:RNA polymerase sigma-70 factor (ECF subfamily)
MASGTDFSELMVRLRRGDQDAAAEVFRRLADGLLRLAENRLGRLARSRLDSEDVVNSAFKSLLSALPDGQFDPECWGGLWALLTTITRRHAPPRAATGRRDRAHRAEGTPG